MEKESPMTENDRLYAEARPRSDDFNFGASTAAVFDDMLTRSVPFYDEIQRMMVEMATSFAVENTRVYDLGCSTGTTLEALAHVLPGNVHLVGIDYSADMLERAARKLKPYQDRVQLVRGDLNEGVVVENASVVLMNLTLQFVRPLYRDKLIGQISRGMVKNGCLLVVEKVLSKDSTLNRLFIEYYYDFKKKNGYSQMEISQKREALENVLIPYRVQENMELFQNNGFTSCEIFFKWYNFCGFLAHV